MTRSRSTKRQNRALNTLQEKGIGAIGLGVAILLVPLFLSGSQLVTNVAVGLRPIGWVALLAGVAMVGFHRLIKRRTSPPELTLIKPLTPTTKKVIDFVEIVEKSVKATQPTSPVKSNFRTPSSIWSPAVFAAIEWRRFEAVCEKLFGQAGFETKSQSHGADGGVDIWLHSRNAEAPVAVVQCKHWQGKAVGVKELREFFGVMASHKLKRGTYATTSTYTADALQFAKDNGINTLDGAGLLALIAKRTPEQQQELLAVAYEGEYWRPTCASCGIKMLERTPSKGGANFWGCSGYPKCKSRLPMVAALR